VHLCEQKRRWQEERETGVQFGLQAYLRFYEMTQGSAKMKSYADFVASPYYKAFVKFGRHMVAIRAVNPKMFIDWVIKENKKLDHWCHEKVYLEYLIDQIKDFYSKNSDYHDKNAIVGFYKPFHFSKPLIN
jgi:hypothetical protein